MTEDERKAEFKEKLHSLHFGVVPGGYRDINSTSMHDSEALRSQFTGADGEPVFSKERVKDNQSDFRRAYKEYQGDS